MIGTIFSEIANAISEMLSALTSAISGVTSLFYVAPTGTETTGHMTFLGVLLLIAVGVGIVYWAFNLIRGLVRRA